MRVPVFVVSPVVINILTGFKSIVTSYSYVLLFALISSVEEEGHKGHSTELIYKHQRQLFISSVV